MNRTTSIAWRSSGSSPPHAAAPIIPPALADELAEIISDALVADLEDDRQLTEASINSPRGFGSRGEGQAVPTPQGSGAGGREMAEGPSEPLTLAEASIRAAGLASEGTGTP